jgi:ABC-2 type transport system ATP-binding protein
MTVLLQSDAVRVEYDTLVAVRDVSFELSGGELLGLVGPNGAGKTTLLRVLAGLHAPTRGQAMVMGRPVLGEHEVVRHHVGFAPDSPPAYEQLTIVQFLRFIAAAYGMDRGEADERIDFWLEKLWLLEKRDALVKTLSKGMRQRVTLARTFLPRPHVVLLDEPLSGLDPGGRIQLRGVLSMLRNQGCAMIVSSHILSDLEEVATHIAIIEHGRLLRYARTQELTQADVERRTYRLTVLDDRDGVAQTLTEVEGVSDLRREGRVYVFDYRAGDDVAAKLLRDLITSGVDVVSFSEVRASLEESYLRAGVKQVD